MARLTERAATGRRVVVIATDGDLRRRGSFILFTSLAFFVFLPLVGGLSARTVAQPGPVAARELSVLRPSRPFNLVYL